MLKFHAKCPRCGEVTDLPEENRGLRIRCPECHGHFAAGDPAWRRSSSFVARLLSGLSYRTPAVGVAGGLMLVAWGARMGHERVVVSWVRNYSLPALHAGFALGIIVALLAIGIASVFRSGTGPN
jgi:hypothetical protein